MAACRHYARATKQEGSAFMACPVGCVAWWPFLQQVLRGTSPSHAGHTHDSLASETRRATASRTGPSTGRSQSMQSIMERSRCTYCTQGASAWRDMTLDHKLFWRMRRFLLVYVSRLTCRNEKIRIIFFETKLKCQSFINSLHGHGKLSTRTVESQFGHNIAYSDGDPHANFPALLPLKPCLGK